MNLTLCSRCDERLFNFELDQGLCDHCPDYASFNYYSITVTRTTINGITDLKDSASVEELYNYFEINYPDSIVLHDVDLQSIIHTLKEGGYTSKKIEAYNSRVHGLQFNFYYLICSGFYLLTIDQI